MKMCDYLEVHQVTCIDSIFHRRRQSFSVAHATTALVFYYLTWFNHGDRLVSWCRIHFGFTFGPNRKMQNKRFKDKVTARLDSFDDITSKTMHAWLNVLIYDGIFTIYEHNNSLQMCTGVKTVPGILLLHTKISAATRPQF